MHMQQLYDVCSLKYSSGYALVTSQSGQSQIHHSTLIIFSQEGPIRMEGLARSDVQVQKVLRGRKCKCRSNGVIKLGTMSNELSEEVIITFLVLYQTNH